MGPVIGRAIATVTSRSPEHRLVTAARAIYAAVAGAQLMARSRADLKLFDALIESFRGSGLIPA